MLLLLHLWGAPAQAIADSCASIDLRKSTLQGIPTYDQGRTSTCYAQVAAIMIDALRKKRNHPVPPLSSPLALALEYSQNLAESNRRKSPHHFIENGGSISDAINSCTVRGTCRLDSIPQSKRNISSSQLLEIYRLIAQIYEKNTFRKIEQWNRQFQTTVLKKPQEQVESDYVIEKRTKILETMEAYLHCNCDRTPEKILYIQKVIDEMKQITHAQLMKELVHSKNEIEFLQKTYFKSCESQRTPVLSPLPKSSAVFRTQFYPVQKMTAFIEDQLQKKQLPVGLTVCSDFFKKGKAAQTHFKKFDPTQCNGHGVAIIGSRSAHGQCQFLLRNSWGTDCSYHSDWPCDSRGDLWVDETTLQNNFISIETIE